MGARFVLFLTLASKEFLDLRAETLLLIQISVVLSTTLDQAYILLDSCDFLQVCLDQMLPCQLLGFDDGGLDFGSRDDWLLEVLVRDHAFIRVVDEALPLLVDDFLVLLVKDFLFLLVDDGLVNFVDVFLMNDWLMEFMNYGLMSLMNYVLVLLRDDILMMLMNHILMLLLNNWSDMMLLNNWSSMMLQNLGFGLRSINNCWFLVRDNHRLLLRLVNNWL